MGSNNPFFGKNNNKRRPSNYGGIMRLLVKLQAGQQLDMHNSGGVNNDDDIIILDGATATGPSGAAVIAGGNDYVDRGSYWVWMYYLLMVFRNREGHCCVPVSHTEQGWPLGRWLGDQRRAYKMGTIDATNQLRLEQSNVPWDLRDYQWEQQFERLVRYKQRHGHVNVPQQQQQNNNTTMLGVWVRTQRKLKKAGALDPQRQRKLEDVGMIWDAFAYQWDTMFDLLIQFRNREGHCRVPAYHKEAKGEQQQNGENVKANLGSWLMDQRKRVRTLNPDRRHRLEQAGVVFDDARPHGSRDRSKQQHWENMFQMLVQYKEQHGHTNVPRGYDGSTIDGRPLGTWLMNQRKDYKVGTMDTTRYQKLEALGIVWDPRAVQWESMFARLEDFQKQHGHCRVPEGYHHRYQEEEEAAQDGEMKTKLGIWLKNQKAAQKAGRLGRARSSRLLELGAQLPMPPPPS